MSYFSDRDYARYLRSAPRRGRGYTSPYHEGLIRSNETPYLFDRYGTLILAGSPQAATAEQRRRYAQLRKSQILLGTMPRPPRPPRSEMDEAVELATIVRAMLRRERRHSKARRSR